MSILTKEVIQKILNDDWLLMDDCEGLENCTVIKELARMALAAMDSEPVAGEARFKEERPRWTPCTAEHVSMVLANPEDWPNYEVRYLYAAPQPAPVVPEAMPTYAISPYSGAEYEAGYRDGWNACRAAMLAAAPHSPGSEPATVPGKWIPVSERMPEEGGRYWCYVEEQNSLGKSHYQWNCSWNGDVWSDKALTGRVTHWMPLPASPQEAINALISVVSRNEPEGK
ncbi:DUF551 domain-containing protein [Klebsiella variicola subsp. variicola]|nr:DUF551 domain-containing protein [Klebsiella variicola]MCJ7051599.1 DUF551 domain-containing protein [Klebsiella variicola]